jgi:chromosome partitioning protein
MRVLSCVHHSSNRDKLGRMRMIVLHTPKGGSGKSTLARELAVAAGQAGLSVALADLDPQQTTTGWYRRRQVETPALVPFTPAGDTSRFAAAGVDLLFVDTPPGQPPFIEALLHRADGVLVPVRPTPDDLLSAAPIARSLARHPAWAFVLSQVPPRSRLTEGAARQLAALGRVAPVQFTFRADYPAAAIEGKAAIEFTGKAAQEAAALYAYVALLIGEPHAVEAEG